MPRTVANSVASIDTPVLLLALLALMMTTLVAYDDNVSILLALMVVYQAWYAGFAAAAGSGWLTTSAIRTLIKCN